VVLARVVDLDATSADGHRSPMASDVPVVPATWVTPTDTLSALPTGEFVVKPTVSAGAGSTAFAACRETRPARYPRCYGVSPTLGIASRGTRRHGDRCKPRSNPAISTRCPLQRRAGHLDTVAATALGQVQGAVRLRQDRMPFV